MTLFPKSIICSVCIILLNGSSEARTPEERLKLLAKSEFDTVIAVLNEYFLDSKINHDKLINDTENFIVQYRSHFLKDFNFGSAKVTDCLRKYLQTDCPIEARECAQDEEYDNLKRQIFQTISEKHIEENVKKNCKDLDSAKPQTIAECVETAKNEIVKNSGFGYSTVESKLSEIFGKAKTCLEEMKKGYNEAGQRAEKHCPKT